MQTTQGAHGIANGHWESEESRTGWLLLLARMSVAELRTLGELARAVTHHARDTKLPAELADRPPIAAE